VDQRHSKQALIHCIVFYILYVLRWLLFLLFFTEHVFQNLRLIQPENERVESVHYLPYPVPNENLFDDVTERIVNRTKSVIQLGRQARDKANMPIKQPLKELIVFQKDEQFVKDIFVLEEYIKEEVNVRVITIKSEGFQDSIQLKPTLDKKRLGGRLRGELKNVEKAILELKQENLIQFEKDGKMEILGFEITKEDVTISNEFVGDGNNQKAAWNDDVLIVLNLVLDDDLKREGIFREVANRIQRLRKKAGLVPTDSGILAYYKLGTASKPIEEAIAHYLQNLEKKTKVVLIQQTNNEQIKSPLASDVTKLNGIPFTLHLVRQ